MNIWFPDSTKLPVLDYEISLQMDIPSFVLLCKTLGTLGIRPEQYKIKMKTWTLHENILYYQNPIQNNEVFSIFPALKNKLIDPHTPDAWRDLFIPYQQLYSSYTRMRSSRSVLHVKIWHVDKTRLQTPQKLCQDVCCSYSYSIQKRYDPGINTINLQKTWKEGKETINSYYLIVNATTTG